MKRTSILHIELRELHIEAIPGPIRHLCLACCPVDSLTKTTVMMRWPSGIYSHGTAVIATRYVFFFTKKKRKCCLQLFVVSCLLFLWLFCHGLLKHLPRLRAQMRWWRDVVYTRRRKTKEVEVKLESSTAQQPTAIPAGHVERPPWKEKKKKEAFFFFFQVRWTDVSGHQL